MWRFAVGGAVVVVVGVVALQRVDNAPIVPSTTTTGEARPTVQAPGDPVIGDTGAPSDPSTTAPDRTTAETAPTATEPSLAMYDLAATRRCLLSTGFVVSSVRSKGVRLRALGDLAQRTSLELRRDKQVLGLALGDARLLESLLLVPNDPYRLEVHRNALLMYRPAARPQAKVVIGCLRS